MPTLLIQLDSEEVVDNVNPACQTLHSSNKTTDYSQAMARQLVEMRPGKLEKGEELGAELDRELENDGGGNGDMKRSTSATE
jgi:hypothetical protein